MGVLWLAAFVPTDAGHHSTLPEAQGSGRPHQSHSSSILTLIPPSIILPSPQARAGKGKKKGGGSRSEQYKAQKKGPR